MGLIDQMKYAKIEKQPYIPQEQPMTPVDGLAKMLDEKKED